MKYISNFRNATVSDIECDGLLDVMTKMHVLSFKLKDKNTVMSIAGCNEKAVKSFLKFHIDNGIPVVFHNGIGFDAPALEKLYGVDLSNLMVIDTLYLSYYLNIGRDRHGLDSFFEDYGIAKPKIDDWENLSFDEYKNRCETDVAINVALWDDFVDRLTDMYSHVKAVVDSGEAFNKKAYDGERLPIEEFVGKDVDYFINNIISFLCMKADMAYLREKTRIKGDLDLIENSLDEVESEMTKARTMIESVMPKVPAYKLKKKPAKPFKKDGTLSASGLSWNEAVSGLNEVTELGHPKSKLMEGHPDQLKIFDKYDEPNMQSVSQLKSWFFSLGWKPQSFEYKKDKKAQQEWVDSGFKKELKPVPKKIPQVQIDDPDGEGKILCPSVLKLAEQYPEIAMYANYTVLAHRKSIFKGFKEQIEETGYITAGVKGLTNTLRERHRGVVNLPSVDKFMGKAIRGSLTCKESEVLMGSDLSSLEDRVKNHFCMAFDPDYVESISVEGYDPHVSMCHAAGYISEEDMLAFFAGDKRPHVKEIRSLGKTVNYSSIYGASPETIALQGGMPLKDAKILHEAYWKMHWYVKAIAEDVYTFHDSYGKRWLINPLNGICYSVRADKDIFSTLIQGSGSYLFDIWVDNIITTMYNQWGIKKLSLLMHDELAFPLKDSEKAKEMVYKLIKDAIMKVNEQYNLRIKLDCEVQFGKNYAEIH